ncbi:hypothetical protein BJ912DRAFT_1067197 [Pholiota molesta]|nr:hypothetical protein BJ912DRAFT_1067197 [Pholiota molesta]
MANDFCDLPQELQIEILSNLDAVSLARCTMTCKSMRETVHSSSILVYTVQLHLDGLKDGRMSTSHPDLIDTIVLRRQAWRSLDAKEPLTRKTQRGRAEELAGGAFATMSKDRDHLEIIWLPTAGNTEDRRLQLPMTGITVQELTMDPTQDLLVFLEDRILPSTIDTQIICVHVHSLSTNTVHPRAKQSPLQFTVHNNTSDTYYWTRSDRANFQIAYNILAVYFTHAPMGTRVLIWDWTTSDLLLDSATSFDRSLPTSRYSFGLLDPTYFFITSPSDCGSIRLYRLAQFPKGSTTDPTHLATLHFPPTRPPTKLRMVSNVAGPTEANPPPHLPFMVNDDARILMFRLEYDPQNPLGDWLSDRFVNVFVHQRLLLKYARQALSAPAPLDVPWTDWGPANTRLIESTSSQYVRRVRRFVHGQRVVFTGRNIGEDGQMVWPPRSAAYIFDFSLAAVLSAKGALATRPPSSSSVPMGNQGRCCRLVWSAQRPSLSSLQMWKHIFHA